MNSLFEIKVCGINDITSMNTALKCKVDYIGLVFYQNSPRNVSINLSKELLKSRNKITKIVALTVDPNDDFLNEIKKIINPDYIQLHGNENSRRCLDIKHKINIPLIKGINVKNKIDLIRKNKEFEDICDILLFDAQSESLPGGNGKKFDWDILKDFKSKKKWMLAGGLNIENIENAIDITKAPAIDISSGLEIRKGLKDPQLIKDFVIKCKSL